jgi:hypothetical protein
MWAVCVMSAFLDLRYLPAIGQMDQVNVAGGALDKGAGLYLEDSDGESVRIELVRRSRAYPGRRNSGGYGFGMKAISFDKTVRTYVSSGRVFAQRGQHQSADAVPVTEMRPSRSVYRLRCPPTAERWGSDLLDR